MEERFEIISRDFYSNCLLEAIKVKLKNWKNIKITYISPFENLVFCPHVMWSDGRYDYDFGNEGKRDSTILNWTLHKGHIRKRKLGFNQKCKMIRRKWRNKHKRKIF